MKWYNVELEISIYGKEFELVNAVERDDAESIALNRIIKKYNCSPDSVEIIQCKVIED